MAFTKITGENIANTSNLQVASVVTSGNLGIGTSSPSYNLSIVSSGSTATLSLKDSGTSDSGRIRIRSQSESLEFITGAGVTMTLDESGNLGLRVTPSAWQTAAGSTALQFLGSSIYGYRDSGIYIQQNAYFDGSWKYYTTGASGRYGIAGNQHQWDIASSGTAGNAISWTQAMTLDTSGNLCVGVTATAGSSRAIISGNTRQLALSDGTYNWYQVVGNNYWSIQSGEGTERARIDSNGNLSLPDLTGTSNTIQTGTILGRYVSDGNGTRYGGVGTIRTPGTGGGITSGAGIGFYTSSNTYGGYSQTYNNSLSWLIYGYGTLLPYNDNNASLGDGAHRTSVIYSATGSINTSDRNEKQDIFELSSAEKLVAQEIKTLFRTFRWKNAVATKGDSARIHVGVIAQDVEEAFKKHGLDHKKYALWCSDTWYEKDGFAVFLQEGGEPPEGSVVKTRLGIRYDQLLAFVISAM